MSLYFWLVIIAKTTLSTEISDFMDRSLDFGYTFGSLILVICLITIHLGDVGRLSYLIGVIVSIIVEVIALHYFSKLNQILLFWIAFVFTSPFGVTFGDLLTKPVDKGGLNLGTLLESLISMVSISILIYVSHQKHQKKTLQESL